MSDELDDLLGLASPPPQEQAEREGESVRDAREGVGPHDDLIQRMQTVKGVNAYARHNWSRDDEGEESLGRNHVIHPIYCNFLLGVVRMFRDQMIGEYGVTSKEVEISTARKFGLLGFPADYLERESTQNWLARTGWANVESMVENAINQCNATRRWLEGAMSFPNGRPAIEPDLGDHVLALALAGYAAAYEFNGHEKLMYDVIGAPMVDYTHPAGFHIEKAADHVLRQSMRRWSDRTISNWIVEQWGQ